MAGPRVSPRVHCFATLVQKVLGEDGVELVTRIAGLLLSAIAVQMIADSVQDFASTWS